VVARSGEMRAARDSARAGGDGESVSEECAYREDWGI
jgi:hypothetical protein